MDKTSHEQAKAKRLELFDQLCLSEAAVSETFDAMLIYSFSFAIETLSHR
jgi:hypothetical protein